MELPTVGVQWSKLGVGPSIDRTRLLDSILILAVPAGLVGLFVLPVEFKRLLVLEYADPALSATVTMHFVHFELSHLLSNLLGYMIVVPLAYWLAVLGDSRRAFFVGFGAVLLVFPFVLSGLDLLYERQAIGFGFSGLIMAFVGLVPVFAVRYFNRRVSAAVDLDWAPVLFLAGTVVVAVRGTMATPVGWLTTGVALGTTVLYGLLLVGEKLDWRLNPSFVRSRAAEAVFGLTAVGLAGLVLFVAFPPDPVEGNTVSNLYLHFTGYGVGAVFSYATFQAVGLDL